MWLILLLIGALLALFLVRPQYSTSNYSLNDLSTEYNGSLTDPSLVRLSYQGPLVHRNSPMNNDCLKLMNPSTLLLTCSGESPSSLRTSSQWYLGRPDPENVIIEPIGWLVDLPNPTQYWYSQLITYEEYVKRLARSTMGPVKFPELIHREPF